MSIMSTLNNAIASVGLALASVGATASTINYPSDYTTGNFNVNGVTSSRFNGSFQLPLFIPLSDTSDVLVNKAFYVCADSSLGAFSYNDTITSSENLVVNFPYENSNYQNVNFNYLYSNYDNSNSVASSLFDFHNCYLTYSLSSFKQFTFAYSLKIERVISGNFTRFYTTIKLLSVDIGTAQTNWLQNLYYSFSADIASVSVVTSSIGDYPTLKRSVLITEQNYVNGSYSSNEFNYTDSDSNVLLSFYNSVRTSSITDTYFYIPISFNFSLSQIISVSDNDSYLKGYNNGRNDGYDQGYSDGEKVGYENGKKIAVDNALEKTGFLALFNAVLGAPTQIIGNSLNFELFGINFSQVVFAIITVSLVAFVIGLLLKRS